MKLFKKGSYFYYAMANGMFYFAWSMFSCIISVYLAGEGCSATEISLITSAAPLFAMVTQPVCGFLADKFRSPQKVAVISAVFTVIAGILFAYTKNFVFLFLLNGCTQGFLNGITALSDRMATAGPYPFGTIRFWGSVWYAVGAQVSGIVYDTIAPIANYYIFAIGIVLMIIGFLGMYDVKPHTKEANTETKITTKEVLKKLWHNKGFKAFMIIYILFQGPTSANGIYLPLLIKAMGGTTVIVGTTLLFSTLFEIPTVLFSDRIMRKISYKHLMMFASALSFIRFAWYATCPTASAIMYMFFFQGLTSIIFILVAVRIIIDLVEPQYVNTAYGISSMLAKGLSALLFQIGAGNLLDVFTGKSGFRIIYAIFAGAMIISLLLSCQFHLPKLKETE